MIVCCCRDLIFGTKIRSTAEAVGVPFRAANTAQALRDRLQQIDDGKLNEPVTGVLIDLELGDDAPAMIRQVKQESEHIPVVAFGSHVATAVLDAARQAGADHVMPRSQFAVSLPQLLQRFGGAEL